MGLLDTSGGHCALARHLRPELLPRRLTTGALASRLLGTCHGELEFFFGVVRWCVWFASVRVRVKCVKCVVGVAVGVGVGRVRICRNVQSGPARVLPRWFLKNWRLSFDVCQVGLCVCVWGWG